ncbi:MAG: glycerol kinase GlpK [Bacteriovoracaceae bacterium]|jgi:glycerol kinase|nr:glycerol kinase GlpK [Bacteriovoracaceae bacterium]
MKKYILSIDQGTTGSTALIIDAKSLDIVSKINHEFTQHFPNPGHVEHDLNDIYQSIKKATQDAILKASINANDIISIGITNQRETTCAYNKNGEPLAKAIVWQDRRTSLYCEENKNSYTKLQELTGLPLDPYFSGTKMRWLIKNNPNVKRALDNGDLKLSTIDTFILYKLTNGTSFKTDASNASRTLLMSLNDCKWNDSLLNFFEVPKSTLPTIENSIGEFGITKGLDFLPDGIPINCILGDQQAALFGQACFEKGQIKCTYGTGAFILANTGDEIIHSKNGMLTTVAYMNNNKPVYAIEGSTYIAGAAVQWLRDGLKIIKSAKDTATMAKESDNKDTKDLFFFPFFTGIGAPYWNPNARGMISGITRGTNNNDIVKVCLEGICQSVCDSIESMEKDLGHKLSEIQVDGGACANDYLMQIQANFSDKTIVRPTVIETTAFGVALGSYIHINNIDILDSSSKKDIDQKFSYRKDQYYNYKRNMWIESIKKF